MKMTCSAAGGAGGWRRMVEHHSDMVMMLNKMIVFRKDMVREWIMREEVNDGGGKKCGRGDEEE